MTDKFTALWFQNQENSTIDYDTDERLCYETINRLNRIQNVLPHHTAYPPGENKRLVLSNLGDFLLLLLFFLINIYAVTQYMLSSTFNSTNFVHSYGKVGLILVILCLSSCASNQSVSYFQNNNSTNIKYSAVLSSSNPAPLRIQSDDILAIVVSSMSEETNNLFNKLNSNSINSTGGGQPLGYLVDVAGEVNLPLIGRVIVAGLTLVEANTYITSRLDRYIKSPTVNVHVLNHKFTVIGEVARPGIFNLSDNSTTLFEVIGMAGDLTIYGQRNNVRLIRTVNNKREIIELDLTSQQIFNSPYYFIENNDVVYVKSRPGKTLQTERSVQLLPIGLAVTSSVVLLYSLFTR